MAKSPYKLPNVFVGCPYGGRFKFAQFKTSLERLPFRFFYADTRLQTKHLLEILRKYIATADFCVFDISTYNPNVALEIGLADGLGVEYYILLNRTLAAGVPADIQGIQRIEYSNYKDFDERNGLVPQLVRFLRAGSKLADFIPQFVDFARIGFQPIEFFVSRSSLSAAFD